MSNAGSAASGPPGPNPVTKQRTSRGLAAASTSSVSPSDSAMPERQFARNTSASAMSSRSASRPAGSLRSSTTDRFERLQFANTALYGVVGRPYLRNGSPFAVSIFTTSAPRSASIIPAYGPAM